MSDVKRYSFPFLQILQLILITLKLCGTITWSWWWVLAPTILWAGTVVAVLTGLAMLTIIVALLSLAE